MKKYFGTVVSTASGRPLSGAIVRVREQSALGEVAGDLADLYTDSDLTPVSTAGQVTTDDNGFYEFFAANGIYTFEFLYGGVSIRTVTDVEHSEDVTAIQLAASGGAALVGTSSGSTVQSVLDNLSFTQTWNSAGTVFDGFDLEVTDTASQLTSNLIRLETTGATTAEFKVTKRGHIYSNSTAPVLKLGPASETGGGNLNVSGSDVISRLQNYGTGHGVYDILFARGSFASPTTALSGDQLGAFAMRSYTAADTWTTVVDITSGATQNHGASAAGSSLILWNTLNDTTSLRMALEITGSLGGVMNHYGPITNITTIPTGVNFIGYLSSPSVAAGVDCGGLRHFVATDPTLGSGAAISSTHTAFDAPNFTNGGNKISFRSQMTAAADKWGLFIDGGAQNYLAGALGIGDSTPDEMLDVVGNAIISGTLAAGATTITGTATASGRITGLAVRTSQYFEITNYLGISSTADGVAKIANWADDDFGRLCFGGTTSSYPALKRSSTTVQARLADDSGFATVQGKLQTDTNYTAGAPTATGYLVLYDAAGTAYKVPAEAV